jgi:hypothetical protein
MQKMIRINDKPNVAIFKGKAYWVKNNTVFVSELKKDGKINTETIKELNVFSLPDKEMDSLMKIIDTLNG